MPWTINYIFVLQIILVAFRPETVAAGKAATFRSQCLFSTLWAGQKAIILFAFVRRIDRYRFSRTIIVLRLGCRITFQLVDDLNRFGNRRTAGIGNTHVALGL